MPLSTITRRAWSMPCSIRSPANIARASLCTPAADAIGGLTQCVSRGRKRQSDRAAEIGRRIPRELAYAETIFGNALKEALHRHFGDQARHLAAQTKMLAGSKAKMAL